MKTRMKSATGLAGAAALAEATTAPTGALPEPRLIASDGLLRGAPPGSRPTRLANVGTAAGREPGTRTDDPGVREAARPTAERDVRCATPLFAEAAAP